MRAFMVVALAGCGRLGFDRTSDASSTAPADAMALPAKFADHCAVLLHMDEPTWQNGNPVENTCTPASPGMVQGAADTVDDPIRGRVGRFAADTACITIADAPAVRATTAVTTSAWVSMTGDPVNGFGLVAKRVDFGVGVEYTSFIWTNSDAWVDIDTENDRFNGNIAIVPSRWTQVTTVYDGSRAATARTQIYIDGVLDTVGAESSATIPQFHSPLAIGCLPLSGPGQALIGSLDEVAVWTKPLTATDVSDWYALTKR